MGDAFYVRRLDSGNSKCGIMKAIGRAAPTMGELAATGGAAAIWMRVDVSV